MGITVYSLLWILNPKLSLNPRLWELWYIPYKRGNAGIIPSTEGSGLEAEGSIAKEA